MPTSSEEDIENPRPFDEIEEINEEDNEALSETALSQKRKDFSSSEQAVEKTTNEAPCKVDADNPQGIDKDEDDNEKLIVKEEEESSTSKTSSSEKAEVVHQQKETSVPGWIELFIGATFLCGSIFLYLKAYSAQSQKIHLSLFFQDITNNDREGTLDLYAKYVEEYEVQQVQDKIRHDSMTGYGFPSSFLFGCIFFFVSIMSDAMRAYKISINHTISHIIAGCGVFLWFVASIFSILDVNESIHQNDDNIIMIVGCVFLMVALFGSFFSLTKRDHVPPKIIFILNGFKLCGVILFLTGSILMIDKHLYTEQSIENIERCLTPFQTLSGFDSTMNKECADLAGVHFVQGQDSSTDLNKQYEKFTRISYGIIGKWNASLIDYYHGAICYITGSIFFLVEGILYFALSLKDNCA